MMHFAFILNPLHLNIVDGDGINNFNFKTNLKYLYHCMSDVSIHTYQHYHTTGIYLEG